MLKRPLKDYGYSLLLAHTVLGCGSNSGNSNLKGGTITLGQVTEAPGELEEVLYALTGWVARMESQRRSKRTKAGLDRVRQGKKLGRPKGSKDKKKRRKRTIRIYA